MICPSCQAENPERKPFCGDCGAPLPPATGPRPAMATETLRIIPRELATGATFAGRYQIIEELGQGGMGRVYKVLDMKIGEKVALKIIRPEAAVDRLILDRFSNELKLARKIRHKNVCQMFDLGEDRGAYYITMEYVRGEDLKQILRKMGRLSPGQAVGIARQVCEGLAEAHRLGVIHRDLKPQNIMLDEEGGARIMDFGIARSLAGNGLTGAGMIIGTPEYMSPEQLEAKEADPRSDLYALGVVLYEMVAGRPPFEGDTPISVAHKQKYDPPEDPGTINSQIPAALSRIILKCLEKDRGKRYATAGEIIADLDRIEKAFPPADRVVRAGRPLTSKETTVKLKLKKLLFPGLAAVGIVIAAGIVLWRILPDGKAGSAPASSPSLAVLPFVDDSPEKSHPYLCEGIPNTLINALSGIRDLRVPARTSAFSFAGKGLDIQTIGQKLNVANILEGSIQAAGGKLRVTARLVEAKSGYQRWTATYDRRLEDVFAIQDEIAQSIVRALKMKLMGGQEERLVKRDTENMEAYKDYLEGLYYWNRRTEKNLSQAIDLFSSAVSKDPNYALAYVGLADSYSLISMYGGVPPTEVFPRARAAALKALEIDETLAEAHNSLAYIYERYDWNWRSAEAEFQRALELNPNYATGRFWYGELLAFLGRFDDGIAEIRRAVELDPVSLVINENLGWAYLMAGRNDEALAQLRRTFDMDPSFPATHLMLGFVHIQMKSYGEAVAEMKKARELSGEAPTVVISLGLAYAASGRREEAKAVLAEMTKSHQPYVSPFRMAEVYAALGDLDRAFELANRSIAEKDEWLISIKISPNFAPYRSDPRYRAILTKMGLD